jgi:hypothetical protein
MRKYEEKSEESIIKIAGFSEEIDTGKYLERLTLKGFIEKISLRRYSSLSSCTFNRLLPQENRTSRLVINTNLSFIIRFKIIRTPLLTSGSANVHRRRIEAA